MHDSVIALCQEFTSDILTSQDSKNWGVAVRIKRKYFQDFSNRLIHMGYKINNMAKERNAYYFLHILQDEEAVIESVITHRITSDLVLDLYEEALLKKGKDKKELMTKVRLLSQYVGGYMVR